MEKYEKFSLWYLAIIAPVAIVAVLWLEPHLSVGAPTIKLTQQQIDFLAQEQDKLKAKYGDYLHFSRDKTIYYKGVEVNESSLSALLPDNIRVDTYSGPHGDGFTIKEFRTATREYYDYDLEQTVTGDVEEVRELNFGPDPNKGHDWIYVEI